MQENTSPNNIDLQKINRVHFVGIGGIGMSGLARLLHHSGKTVSGDDTSTTVLTDALKSEGITICDAQKEENVTKEIDLVIYTEAVPHDHPELARAHSLRIPCINYFEGLGIVANKYKLIAVAGTHGKTTTTSMVIDILEDAGYDPTAIVGSLRARTGSNYRAGKSSYFVVEACEYKRDFLTLEPDILIITNIEYEHVDYFKDLADVQDAFKSLVHRMKPGGTIIADIKDPAIAPVLKGTHAHIIDVNTYFDPLRKISIPGLYNMQNATAAVATATRIGISETIANETLAHFKNSWRRFEFKGTTLHDVPVYDDYAHHPTELRAVISAAREKYPDRNLIVVHQPHTYSRLAVFFDDFVNALKTADKVFIAPVYRARKESQSEHVSSDLLAQNIGTTAVSLDDLESLNMHIIQEIMSNPHSVIVIAGAGNITTALAEKLVSATHL